MTTEPTGGPRLPRRHLLTVFALASLPAACSAAPAEPVVAAPLPPPPTGATPSATVAATTSATRSASPSVAVSPSTSATPTATGTTTAATATTAEGGPVPFRPGKVLLGSYVDLQGRSAAQSRALRRSQLGRDQRIVHAFNSWTEELYLPDVADGSTLMLSWNGTRYSEVTGGSADRRIAAAARRLAAYRRPVLLRWAWEMNGDWFAWGGARNGRDTAAYVTAWRRIHRIFSAEGADNVAFVWSPNWNSGPDEAWNRFTRYYPGDAYVDWVGVSGYNFYQESPQTLFTPICKAYAGRKPIIITETAAIEHGGASKADWINRLSAWVKATPAVGGLVWFDTDTHDGGKQNFRFDSTEAALAAYRAMVRSPRFTV